MYETFTRANPDGKSFRIPIERCGEFRILQSGNSIAMFGDIVDKLGRYEKAISLAEAERYALTKR